MFSWLLENLTKIIILLTASIFLFVIVTQAHGMPGDNLAKKAALTTRKHCGKPTQSIMI